MAGDVTLLSRIIAAQVAACNCGTKTGQPEHHQPTCRYGVLRECFDQIEEFEQSFELRWAADMRAIKRWQEANPGNDLTWPDHADLVVWLLGQIKT